MISINNFIGSFLFYSYFVEYIYNVTHTIWSQIGNLAPFKYVCVFGCVCSHGFILGIYSGSLHTPVQSTTQFSMRSTNFWVGGVGAILGRLRI